MKKIIALALVVVMLFAMTTLFASAADLTPDVTSKDITISYGAGEYYEVTIPPNITLGDLGESVICSTGLKLEKVSLLPGNKLKVTALSANNFAVAMKGTNHKVPYSMTYGANDTVVSNSVGPVTLVDIESGVETLTCPIAFTRTGNAAVSGFYTDTVTFTVAVYR